MFFSTEALLRFFILMDFYCYSILYYPAAFFSFCGVLRSSPPLRYHRSSSSFIPPYPSFLPLFSSFRPMLHIRSVPPLKSLCLIFFSSNFYPHLSSPLEELKEKHPNWPWALLLPHTALSNTDYAFIAIESGRCELFFTTS